MKILIYSANFAPEPTGIGKYSGEMAAWLVSRGHQVRVVAAPPYYPSWKLAEGYAWPPYRREQWRGVSIWRAPLWVPKSPGGLVRILHLVTFALSSFPVMMRQIFWRADVVLTVAPAFVCAPAGWLTARLSRAQAWLHIQDFEVDVAFQLGLLKNKLLQRLTLGLERWMLRRFDSVSSISHRMVDRLIEKGIPQERTRFFPNWVDTEEIKPAQESDGSGGYRESLGIGKDAIVLLFSGTLGAKQGLMLIPEAAERLADRKDIQFVICGDGVMKPRLEQAAARLPNLHLLPLQPLERLGALLGMADIHLLTQSPGAADLVLPSKLSGMVASGRPIIATCHADTEIAAIVSTCGLVVPPEDPSQLVDAVLTLVGDPARRLELGRRARIWAESNIERNVVLGIMFGSGTEKPLATRVEQC